MSRLLAALSGCQAAIQRLIGRPGTIAAQRNAAAMDRSSLITLFTACKRLDSPESRLAFAYANPRLLSLASLQALADRHGRSSALLQLVEVQARLARHPETYPLGAGPIEALLRSGVDIDLMVQTSRSDEFQARIAPLYLSLVARHAAQLARSDDWRTAAGLSLLAMQAALAWEPTKPTHTLVVETLQLNLSVTISACSAQLDDGLFARTLAATTELLSRMQARNERLEIGLVCHGLGALYSDLWTMPGRADDPRPVEARAWAQRPVVDPGLFGQRRNPPAIPPAAEALRLALEWYERALPFRSGAQRGLTYKAMLQTMAFANLVLDEPLDESLFTRCLELAPELLEKHQDNKSHLQSVFSCARALGKTPGRTRTALATEDQRLLELIAAHTAPVPDGLPDSAQRREAHAAAQHDIGRALRHGLPWVVCLRNFDFAAEYFRLGEDVVEKSGGSVRLVVPVIRYSLVDHKILELFPECAVGVVDPRPADNPRLTAIPMLTLGDGWATVVEALVARATRTVMLLDAISPGVLAELDLLVKLGAESRTLIVTGHQFRASNAELPATVAERFPFVVDWIDFGFDEAHTSLRHKAHGPIADELVRYVRCDARPTVRAWLNGEAPALSDPLDAADDRFGHAPGLQ